MIVVLTRSEIVQDMKNAKLPEAELWDVETSPPPEPDGPWISPTIYYAHLSNLVDVDFYMVCAYASRVSNAYTSTCLLGMCASCPVVLS